jgi:hypothetical protein
MVQRDGKEMTRLGLAGSVACGATAAGWVRPARDERRGDLAIRNDLNRVGSRSPAFRLAHRAQRNSPMTNSARVNKALVDPGGRVGER